MIHAQAAKEVALFKPQSVATNGTASGTVDCVGFEYAVLRLHLDTATAANTDVLLRVSEGDTTSAFTTSTDFNMTTAAPDTSNQQIYCWYLALSKRKRYLKLEYSPSASAARLASATATLSRAENLPTTAAQHGVAGQVIL